MLIVHFLACINTCNVYNYPLGDCETGRVLCVHNNIDIDSYRVCIPLPSKEYITRFVLGRLH